METETARTIMMIMNHMMKMSIIMKNNIMKVKI